MFQNSTEILRPRTSMQNFFKSFVCYHGHTQTFYFVIAKLEDRLASLVHPKKVVKLMEIFDHFDPSKKPLKLRIWLNPPLTHLYTLHRVPPYKCHLPSLVVPQIQ